MNEKINAANDNIDELDQIDEETVTYEVSDEAMEAAATGFGGLSTTCSFFSAPCC